MRNCQLMELLYRPFWYFLAPPLLPVTICKPVPQAGLVRPARIKYAMHVQLQLLCNNAAHATASLTATPTAPPSVWFGLVIYVHSAEVSAIPWGVRAGGGIVCPPLNDRRPQLPSPKGTLLTIASGLAGPPQRLWSQRRLRAYSVPLSPALRSACPSLKRTSFMSVASA